MLQTEVVWLEGREVVELRFDPGQLSFEDLLVEAQKLGCTSRVFARSDGQLRQAQALLGEAAQRSDARVGPAQTSDAKHSLQRSPWRFLPLTPFQATKCNAALAACAAVEAWLSPRQQALSERIQRALAADPSGLEGLRPPADWRQLAEYAAELERRLQGAGF